MPESAEGGISKIGEWDVAAGSGALLILTACQSMECSSDFNQVSMRALIKIKAHRHFSFLLTGFQQFRYPQSPL